jgi:hypothetical protein
VESGNGWLYVSCHVALAQLAALCVIERKHEMAKAGEMKWRRQRKAEIWRNKYENMASISKIRYINGETEISKK